MLVEKEIDEDNTLIQLKEAHKTFNQPEKYPLLIKTNYKDITNALTHQLLINPNPHTFSTLVSLTRDNFYQLTLTIKQIIKEKYLFLKPQIRINITQITHMLSANEKVADSLVINLLRYARHYPGIVGDMEQIVQAHPEHCTHILPFLSFFDFKRFYAYFKDTTVLGRDIHLSSFMQNDTFSINEDNMHIPTPKHFLIARITPELELNILFMLEKSLQNKEIYYAWIFKEHITTEAVAADALRYVISISHPSSNTFSFIDAVLNQYPKAVYALLIDIFYFSDFDAPRSVNVGYLVYAFKNSVVDRVIKEALKEDRFVYAFRRALAAVNVDTKSLLEYYNLNENNPNLNPNLNIKRKIEELESLDFKKYMEVVSEMKRSRVPFIGEDIVNILVGMSWEWDGYVQVYFWKVLVYQKILFKTEPSFCEGKSIEMVEGMEILSNIKV